MRGTARNHGLLQKGYIYQQRCGLAKKIRVKRVRDHKLNSVVRGQRELKKAWILFSIIGSSSESCVPLKCLNLHRTQLDIHPADHHPPKLSEYMTSYPDVFVESSFLDSKGRPRPGFGLTPQALKLYHKQAEILEKNQLELRDRLCRLLMLTRTKDRILPLETIDQLQWDLGLPYDYLNCFVPNHPDRFSLVRLPDGRDGLKLLFWDDKLAVSELMKNASLQQDKEDIKNDGSLAFPVSGFGMKKCMEWLEEWQKLPYTSPYTNASNSDRHTNEKRVVGILHELLHLTLHKQTEVENLSNLCKPFMLHQNLTKVFERHLGIFYLSYNYYEKPTVVLREGYNGRELKQKHPLVRIRQKLANLLKERLDNDENLYNSEEFGYDSDGFPIDIDKLF